MLVAKDVTANVKKCSIRSALHSAFIPDINLPSENKPCGYMYKQEEVNFKRK